MMSSAIRLPARRKGEAPNPRCNRGFTLVELLVVVGVIAILAAMLLPALSKAKEQGRRAGCISNLRQIQMFWQMYASDHNDIIQFDWVKGNLNFSPLNPDNTNLNLLINAGGASLASNLRPEYSGPVPFAEYNRNPSIYKCPSDISVIQYGSVTRPRVRSYSKNWVFNRLIVNVGIDTGVVRVPFKKLSDVINPGPSGQFVFLDENPVSIIEPDFDLDRYKYRFDSLPGSYHDNAAALSFVDGHVETHRWVDPRTSPALTDAAMAIDQPPAGEFADVNGYYGTYTDEPKSPDPFWLHSKSVIPNAGW